ncbi:MAG: hypothetical protein K2M76_00705 [Muribaculaceae bacterium]|nr:hypothetical protein [Muribaculaceae bacterium]
MLHSSRGKDYVVFLLFLLVSYVFWLMLTLNNEIQTDVEIPLELTDVPDSVTIISPVPEQISVSVRDKGSALTRFVWMTPPALRLSFTSLHEADNRMVLTETEIDSRLRALFGSTAQIVSSKPDSLSLVYSTRPGRKMRLELDVDATPNLQYVVSGRIVSSVDSVVIYAVDALPVGMTAVSTMPVELRDLTDTTYVEVKVASIPGARIVPDRVTLCVPVEPLISKTRMIPVRVHGAPANTEVLTFPPMVSVSYLVPMSMYAQTDEPGYALADYRAVDGRDNEIIHNRMPVIPYGLPAYYQNATLDTDSVEFVIEQK